MQCLESPTVPVSWGELLDKITILEIKRERIVRPEARTHVLKEHRLLSAIASGVLDAPGIAPLLDGLKRVNEALWEIEDAVREHEAEGRFDDRFVQLARWVYQRNDERARLKREINQVLNSELVEEKSYAGFVATGTETAPELIIGSAD
ncbi:MAG: hypothetical protein J7500_18130 [Sphingomonas sp.]|uniref:DUF6165 family protein n=1 Tax=Sphingomonas sp. TaxID=28214 RepID=UPI001B14EE19|nr:DUF6165 family protein [Sphingomonas sp.]MBO9624630.1 hypothetical protein [Sphingomonas sp.]